MLLAVDVGNSTIACGVHDGEAWRTRWRLRTVPNKTAAEYAVLLREVLGSRGVPWAVTRLALANVVPPLTPVFQELAQEWLGCPILVVGPGVKTGINLRVDHPSEVGADLVAGAAAAFALYQENCIVVDFGTATTFTAVTKDGALVGVAIAPGVATSAEALANRAAQLPKVPLRPPVSSLPKNTVEAMQAGVVWGHAGAVDGILRRMKAGLGSPVRVVATGDLAPLLAPLIPEIERVEPWLTLDGLRLIADKNPV